ncbi:MAG TPA: ATP-binding protein [Marmoricola sp.]
MSARVVVLAGPSGAGKSHLAARLGLPILRLDDFYREIDDPDLPMIELAGGTPIVDWDDPRSWDRDAALAAIGELCRTGCTRVPAYDISSSRRTDWHELRLGDASLVVAEGIFAQEVVGGCAEMGVLAGAYCVTQWPPRTFVRRLVRDLREHRKPPLVLVRRGWRLLREQAAVVRHAESLGCRVVSPDDAYALIAETPKL